MATRLALAAAGALFLRPLALTLHELRLDPRVPDELDRVVIRGLHASGAEWELEAIGTEGVVCRVDDERP